MEKKEKVVLEMWWEGRYALGWRGALARKLLAPVVKSCAARDVFFSYQVPPL